MSMQPQGRSQDTAAAGLMEGEKAAGDAIDFISFEMDGVTEGREARGDTWNSAVLFRPAVAKPNP